MSIKKIHALVNFGFLASIAATASKGDYFDGGTVSLALGAGNHRGGEI